MLLMLSIANNHKFLIFSWVLVAISQAILSPASLRAETSLPNLEKSELPIRIVRKSEAIADQIPDQIPDQITPQSELKKLGSQEAADKAAKICSSQLPRAIAQVVNQYENSQWGILVTNLNTNQVLYEFNPDRFIIPASNVKLFTSAAVLSQLGGNFRIRTSVYEQVLERGGNFLTAVGRGDPSLDNSQLQRLGQQLLNRGQRNINLLVGDDRYFQGEMFNPAWAWEDIESGEAPPVSSLIVNQSYVQLSLIPQRVGETLRLSWSDELAANQWRINNNSQTTRSGSSVDVNFRPNQNVLSITGNLGVNNAPEGFGLSILEPSLYFVQRFQAELKSLGININQTQTSNSNNRSPLVISPNWIEIAAVESAPLGKLLWEMNRDSNNFYAEMLTRQLGKVAKGDDRAWVTAVGDSLTKLGVDPRGYKLVDGSGLARQNQITPRAIVQTLQAMTKSPEALTYRNSLALAGVHGTLRSRLRNTPAAGNFWGKTGSLRGVIALSGYVSSPGYDPLVVSIIVNSSEASNAILREDVDAIADRISRLQTCAE